MSTGRTRYDGTPGQKTGLGKVADDPKRYKREWARKRRADKAFRDRENAAACDSEAARKTKGTLCAPWEIC